MSFSQIIVTTPDGRDAILSENGTWKYAADLATPVNTSIVCDEYVTIDIDKVTGVKSAGIKEALIISKDGGVNGFGLFMMKSDKGSIIFSFTVVGASSCIDDENKMNILFRDGTRMELINQGGFNCKAKYTNYFGNVFGKKKELELLKTKQIDVIRIWTSDGYVEESLTIENSDNIINTLRCLTNS